MKPIELTEKQKDQLLEMCKVLFPEYSFSWEYEMYGRALKQEFNDVLAIYPDKGWGTNIHWFEFIMGTLASKIDDLYCICNKEKLESKDDNIRITAWDRRPYHDLWSGFNFGALKPGGHPVDYLYKEFKKLNNDELGIYKT